MRRDPSGHRRVLPAAAGGMQSFSGRTTVWIALVVAILGILPQVLSRTLPDIAFPLWAAERMQHGARLYVDILEINPPLFIWLDLPVVALARWLGIGMITMYRVFVFLLLAASLAGSWWALRQSLDDEPAALRRLLWLAAVFALLLLPRLDWGEREHLSLALTLPYILLGIARARDKPVGWGGAVMAGLAAGVGIALKPHFVLVWVGREVASRGSWVKTRDSRPTTHDLRPETITVPLSCIAYLIAVILIHPEYFTLLRELGPAYQRFIHNSLLVTLLLGEGSAIVLGTLVIALALRRERRHAATWRVLLLSLLGYYAAAVLQGKGWRYHFLPALGLAMLLLAVMAWDAQRPPASRLMRLFAAMPVAALVTALLVAGGEAALQTATPNADRYNPDPSLNALIPLVRERAPGRPVYVISPNMASGFPLTQYAGMQWPSRLSNLWPAVVAYRDQLAAPDSIVLHQPDSAPVIERFGRRIAVEDFLRARPPLALALIPVDLPGWGMQRLDLLRWLNQDAAFARAWTAYDSLGKVGNYVVWGRRDDPVASAPVAATAWASGSHGAPDEVGVNPDAAAAAVVFVLILAWCYRRPVSFTA